MVFPRPGRALNVCYNTRRLKIKFITMHKVKTLNNKLRLITVPVQGTKTATILVLVGTGARFETKENNGISHFLEHMVFKGTEKRPNTLAISSVLDGIGGEFNAFTTKENTGFYAKVDAAKIEVAIDVISDMLLNSKFEPEEIEREKGTIIEEINMYEDTPMYHVEDLLEQCLYGDQPMGWEVLGPKDVIRKITRDDFINYLHSQYGTQNMVVCVAGKIDKKIEKLIEKYFSAFKRSKFKNRLPVVEKQNKPSSVIGYKKTDQTHISLGVRGYKMCHKNEYAVKVMSILLGGSLSSRITINLRERRGLAYYVRTGNEFYTDTGYLTTQAGVPVDKIEEAIKIILEEYGRLKNELVGEEELQRVKDLINGRVAIQLESSDANANWYAKQLLLQKKIVTPDEYLGRINKVSAKDLMRVAKDIFTNERLNFAAIGPYEDKGRFDKLLLV